MSTLSPFYGVDFGALQFEAEIDSGKSYIKLCRNNRVLSAPNLKYRKQLVRAGSGKIIAQSPTRFRPVKVLESDYRK